MNPLQTIQEGEKKFEKDVRRNFGPLHHQVCNRGMTLDEILELINSLIKSQTIVLLKSLQEEAEGNKKSCDMYEEYTRGWKYAIQHQINTLNTLIDNLEKDD